MSDKSWTMNCILFGAKLAELADKANKEEAIKEILNLSSELTVEDANYIWDRLREKYARAPFYPR